MISTLIQLYAEYVMEEIIKPKDGITWFKCNEGKPRFSADPIWAQRNQSDKVLLYNDKTRLLCDGYWMGDMNLFSLSKGSAQPTHWAYINYPEPVQD